MDHKNLLKEISTEFLEFLKVNFDWRLSKIFKKVLKIFFELFGGFYRHLNENLNKKEKVKKNKFEETGLDSIQINFWYRD